MVVDGPAVSQGGGHSERAAGKVSERRRTGGRFSSKADVEVGL